MLRVLRIFYYNSKNISINLITFHRSFILTGECPNIFEVFRVQRVAEIWQSSGRFGRISDSKSLFSVSTTLEQSDTPRLGLKNAFKFAMWP